MYAACDVSSFTPTVKAFQDDLLFSCKHKSKSWSVFASIARFMIEHNNVDAKRAGLNVGLTVNQGIGKLMCDWKGFIIAHSKFGIHILFMGDMTPYLSDQKCVVVLTPYQSIH